MKNLDFFKIDARFDSGATRGRNEISAKRKNVSEARRCYWETKKTDKPTRLRGKINFITTRPFHFHFEQNVVRAFNRIRLSKKKKEKKRVDIEFVKHLF